MLLDLPMIDPCRLGSTAPDVEVVTADVVQGLFDGGGLLDRVLLEPARLGSKGGELVEGSQEGGLGLVLVLSGELHLGLHRASPVRPRPATEEEFDELRGAIREPMAESGQGIQGSTHNGAVVCKRIGARGHCSGLVSSWWNQLTGSPTTL